MQFRSWNKILLVVCLVLGMGVLSCRPDAERRLGQETRRELELGRQAAERWQNADTQSNPGETEAIALGYLERLRIGMGSPFRLVDFALSDPRLSDSTRTRLAFALLHRVLQGTTYEIDPLVLDGAGTLGVSAWPGLGVRHLALIDRTIAQAEDPRAAEAAIRLGYGIATAEGVVSSEARTLAAWVAALRVDRSLARQDAADLLAAADDAQSAGLLLRRWRDARRFRVEQPRILPLGPAGELAAIRQATDVVDALRDLGLEMSSRGLPAATEASLGQHRLSLQAAAKLSAAAAHLAAPPQTPIVIAARQLASDAAALPELSAEERAARNRFGTSAVNEESFIAGLAGLQTERPRAAGLARASLQAAVAMRAYAQEGVWFPGMEGPSQRDLQERYGLAGITFDRNLRAEWRPYYRRMLAGSLDDLFRVLPALDLRGLRVHFGAIGNHPDALALHEPDARRLVLPPHTSAGTIAHEIAHDIDWQTALRRYNIRGDYATDRAVTDRNDALARQVRSLASAVRGQAAGAQPREQRPAEIFARNADWFVAVSLAQEGRRNGYLSSAQDELITGYGTVRPPDVSGAAGDAFMTILGQLAPVYREQRTAFTALYGSTRAPRAYDLVRSVVETPLGTVRPVSLDAGLDQLRTVRDNALRAVDGPTCASALNLPAELQTARRRLVLLATEARARGLALRGLQRNLVLTQHSAQSEPAADLLALLVRALYQGPAPVRNDSIGAGTVEPMVQAVTALANDMVSVEMKPFQLDHMRACAAPSTLLSSRP